MSATLVRIVLRKPGWFMMDTTVKILWDGDVVYEGGFREGFEHELEAAHGPHRLEAAIRLGGLGSRTKSWDVDVHGSRITATLRYSRFWGNFKRKLQITVE